MYDPDEEQDKDDEMSKSIRSTRSDVEIPSDGKIKAILPSYLIDSSSSAGLKPTDIKGRLTFDSVTFAYPTRPGRTVLAGFSIDIDAGKTIAFVGPRYVVTS